MRQRFSESANSLYEALCAGRTSFSQVPDAQLGTWLVVHSFRTPMHEISSSVSCERGDLRLRNSCNSGALQQGGACDKQGKCEFLGGRTALGIMRIASNILESERLH